MPARPGPMAGTTAAGTAGAGGSVRLVPSGTGGRSSDVCASCHGGWYADGAPAGPDPTGTGAAGAGTSVSGLSAVEPCGQVGRAGPARWIPGQAGENDRPQWLGQGGQIVLAVHDAVEDRLELTGPERWPPGSRVGQGGREGVHVGGCGTVAALDDLRCQVAGCTHEHARHREPGRIRRLRDAEVDHHGLAVAEHHVRGLQVPVHDSGGVDGNQRSSQAARQRRQRRPGQRAVGRY